MSCDILIIFLGDGTMYMYAVLPVF